MKAYIIDDETKSREELKYILSTIDDVEVVGEASAGVAGLNELQQFKPDVVFLDIEMPGPPGSLNGMAVARLLRESPDQPLVVFATAHPEHAIKAINEVRPFGYVLKPFTGESLKDTVQKVKEYLSRTLKSGMILLYKGKIRFPTPPEEIVFFLCRYGEVPGNTYPGEVLGHTYDDIYDAKKTMHELEDMLSDCHFFRIHRRNLVNTKYIIKIAPWPPGTYTLTMNDKKKTDLIVSRYKAKAFKKYLGL